MQNIFITGNLTKDAELKVTSRQGVRSEFVTFNVACNRKVNDTDRTTFYDVTCAKTGVFEYLKKGQKVTVAGRFSVNQTTGENGKVFVHLNINATEVELSGTNRKGEAPVEDLPEG